MAERTVVGGTPGAAPAAEGAGLGRELAEGAAMMEWAGAGGTAGLGPELTGGAAMTSERADAG